MSNITGTVTELIYASTTPGTAKNTFTGEANLNDTAGMGERPVLPPYLWLPSYGVGRGIRVVARGILSSTGTPTYQLFIRLGTNGSVAGPLILGTAAIATTSGVANALWELQGDFVLTILGTAGANSTGRGMGTILSSGLNPVVGFAGGGGATPWTVATVDVSIQNYVNVSVACSASSASNTITLQQLLVYGLN